MNSHKPNTTEQSILEQAEKLLAEAPMESLLEFLTPERLAKEASFSPAAVRYHFGEEGRKFSIVKLGRALVKRMLSGNRKAAKLSAGGYHYVAGLVNDFADADKVIEGILSDVGQHYGPMLEEDQPTAARERMYLLAILASERDEAVARDLRATDDEVLGEFEEVYELYLQRTGRELVDGVSSRDLAMLISSLLLGATLTGRYNDDFKMELVATTVVRIFWAFTYDPSTQTEALYDSDVGAGSR